MRCKSESRVSIELILENCEVLTIEGEHIGDFCVENIKQSIRLIACNAIEKMTACEHFSISINQNANTKHSMWGSDMEGNKFERLLRYDDITAIEVAFSDGTNQHIYIPWTGEEEYLNESQKVKMNRFGDLFIVVDENKNIEDVFDPKEIEDKGCMDCIWTMYR